MNTEPKTSVVSLQDIAPGIVQITMQDKAHKNTFSEQLLWGLVDAFKTVNGNPKYKVVILTGYDSYFALGGTQEALLAIHESKIDFSIGNIYSLPLECDIPVIAAMQGHGIGGGFVFGLFADFVVMSIEGVYTTNFMNYGFTPGMGATYIVPKKLGMALSEEMLMTGRRYRGADLVNRGVPFPILPRKDVLPRAYETAAELVEKPRVSLVTLKKHLVKTVRANLPAVIEEEKAMHEITFHQPEVRARIMSLFGQ